MQSINSEDYMTETPGLLRVVETLLVCLEGARPRGFSLKKCSIQPNLRGFHTVHASLRMSRKLFRVVIYHDGNKRDDRRVKLLIMQPT
jgi:hypothetical protein